MHQLRPLLVPELQSMLPQHVQIQLLDLRSGPGSLPQKLEAAAHAGVVLKAADVDAPPQFVPAVILGQAGHDLLQRDAVEGVG